MHMNPGPEFWSAVRLAEFANLEIKRENWRTLWEQGERDLLPGLPPLADEYRGGDLWRAFSEGVRRYGAPPTQAERWQALREQNLAADRSDLDRLIVAWEPRAREGGEAREFLRQIREGRARLGEGHAGGEDGLTRRRRDRNPGPAPRPVVAAFLDTPLMAWPKGRYEALELVHRTARERLALICTDGADLRPVIRPLVRFRVPRQRFCALTIPSGTRTDRKLSSRPRKMSPGPMAFRHEPHLKGSTIFVLEQKPLRKTLREHVDELFVRTAVAGLWPRFYQCKGCGRFVVDRLRRDSSRRKPSESCGNTCRSRVHRGRETARDAELRARVIREVVELQDRGVPDALVRVQRQHGLTAKEMFKMLYSKGEG